MTIYHKYKYFIRWILEFKPQGEAMSHSRRWGTKMNKEDGSLYLWLSWAGIKTLMTPLFVWSITFKLFACSTCCCAPVLWFNWDNDQCRKKYICWMIINYSGLSYYQNRVIVYSLKSCKIFVFHWTPWKQHTHTANKNQNHHLNH